MKDISELKLKIANKMAKKYCSASDFSNCPNGHCSCAVAAEMKALLQTIIPSPYFNFSIKDFKGKSASGEPIIDNFIAYAAKKKLVDYIWRKDIDFANIDKYSDQELDSMSIIDSRRKNGTNFIIHGDISYSDYKDNKTKKGRTFISSIIMKEAIRRRLIPGNHIQSYDWLQYSRLKQILSDHDMTSSVLESSNAQTADWLVVDDIVKEDGSKNKQSYISSLLDTFFVERIEDRLPTIMVFRFDVDKNISLIEESFGVSVAKMINDQNTFKINLSEKQ